MEIWIGTEFSISVHLLSYNISKAQTVKFVSFVLNKSYVSSCSISRLIEPELLTFNFWFFFLQFAFFFKNCLEISTSSLYFSTSTEVRGFRFGYFDLVISLDYYLDLYSLLSRGPLPTHRHKHSFFVALTEVETSIL